MLWLGMAAAAAMVWIGGATALPYAVTLYGVIGVSAVVTLTYSSALGVSGTEGFRTLQVRMPVYALLLAAFVVGAVRAVPAGQDGFVGGMAQGAAIGGPLRESCSSSPSCAQPVRAGAPVGEGSAERGHRRGDTPDTTTPALRSTRAEHPGSPLEPDGAHRPSPGRGAAQNPCRVGEVVGSHARAAPKRRTAPGVRSTTRPAAARRTSDVSPR